jgi:hypothetical protein
MAAAWREGATEAAASTGNPGVPVEMYPQSLYTPSRYTSTWCGDDGGNDGGEGRPCRLRPGPAAQVAARGTETPSGREHHEGRAPGCRRPLPQLSRDRGAGARGRRRRRGAAEGVVVDTRTEAARMNGCMHVEELAAGQAMLNEGGLAGYPPEVSLDYDSILHSRLLVSTSVPTSVSRAPCKGLDQPSVSRKAVTKGGYCAKESELKKRVSLVKVSLSKKRFRR